MNEGGNGAEAPQGQNQASPQLVQSTQPTSAVNAGFDASKIGLGKKQKIKKPKKVKEKKGEESKKTVQSKSSKEKTKHPLWFWIVLGVLGVAIIGAVVWAVLVLLGNNNEPSIELISNDTISDTVDNSTVANYISQLQSIYDANNAEGNADSPLSDSSANEVSKAVEKTLNTSQGSSQADLIRLAEMAVAYNNSDYEMAGSVLDKINPDKLGIKDQIYYYAIAETIYEENGNSEKAQEAFSRGGELIRQLCNIQECKQ